MSTPAIQPVTPAAGGVLWRADAGNRLHIAVVHRPRYNDWSLPKGKLNAGEYPLLAAVREVGEETGSRVDVGRRLDTVSYPVDGAPKRVTYWAMRHLSGEHEPGEEVDAIRWLEPAAAEELLSYAADRKILAQFSALPAETTSVLLVRHAKAGRRAQFDGDDRLRPLDKIGRRQARDLTTVLQLFAPKRVLSADRVRCEQTVRGLGERLGRPPIIVPEMSDEAFLADPVPAVELICHLAAESGTSVVCSQGHAIPGLLEEFQVGSGGPYPCRKGSFWALSMFDRRVMAADYYPRPSA